MNQSIPSDIDLRALEAPFYENPTLIGDPSKVGTFVYWHSDGTAIPPRPWFTTVEEMQRGLTPPPPTYASYTSNKFFVTVGTADTNTDAFGRGRIDLQAVTSTAVSAYTAALNSLSDAAWATTLYPGIITGPKTFAAKYGDFGIHQILANIIDYQTNSAATPTGNLDANVTAAGFTAPALDADGIPLYFSGLKKGPMIDEIIVHVATTNVQDSVDPINQTNLEVRVFVDVKFINGYEIPRGNGYVVQVALQGDPVMTYANAAAGSPTWTPVTTADQIPTLSVDVPAHGYRLLGDPSAGSYPPPTYMTTILGVNPSTGPPTLSTLTLKLKHVRLLKSASAADIVDWMAQMDFDQTFPSGMQFPNPGLAADFVPFSISISLVTGKLVTNSPIFTVSGVPSSKPIGLFKQDIRTRTFPGYGVTPGPGQMANNVPLNLYTNWIPVPSTVIFPAGAQPYSSRVSPEVYGLLADLRSIEPGDQNPKQNVLVDQIKEAPILNVGELCYIHTGYPWRALRFRSVVPETGAGTTRYYDNQIPSPYTGRGDPNAGSPALAIEAHSIPDWVLLDIFKVGNASTFSGRINVNTKFSGPAAGLTPRLPPLIALIDNTSVNLSTSLDSPPLAAPGGTGTNVDVIANNIANRVVFLGSPYDSVPAYLTPGQVCEVSNLVYFSDTVFATGIYNANPSKSRRQQLIRRIANMVTARSSTFTIYGMAQTIKEVGTPDGLFNGQDFITGEVKVQAIIDRYEEGGVVKFRTRYYRFIYE
jgi:hypothetical protein